MERLTEKERWKWISNQIDSLLDDAPIKVFAASNCPIIPYRLVNAVNYRPNHGYRARELILDSGIGQESDNGHVLSAARKLGDLVDHVVPKDYPNDMQGTIASLKEFIDIMPANLETKLLIPLQGSTPEEYVECYESASDLAGSSDYFGFGGIAGGTLTRVPNLQPVSKRIAAVQHLLDNTDIAHLHLFGCTNIQWLDLYKDDRIVSCDSARFGQQSKFGGLTGPHGGIVSYFAIANEWIRFLMELVNPQNPTNQATFEDQFGQFP